jgi:tetratricopeptide (TPR) repeat protein
MAAFERAARVDARSSVAWEGIGRLAAAARDGETAERAYRRVVELRPEDPSALSVLATLVEREGRYDEAAGLFRRALDLPLPEGDPDARQTRALAWTGLGTSLLAMGRRDDAYEALAAALTDDPDQPEASWALAPIYLDRGEWRAAAAALHKVVPERADDPMLWVLVGRAEAGQGRWTQARQAFLRALELDPRSHQAKRWLGIALCSLGVYRSAAMTLEEALAEQPDDDLANLNLAVALGQLGEVSAARRRFAVARQLMPGRPEPLYREAHLLLAAGSRAEALELARRAVAASPDDPGALEVLARALAASHERVEGRRRAEEALAHARDDAQRQYLRDLVAELAASPRDDS